MGSMSKDSQSRRAAARAARLPRISSRSRTMSSRRSVRNATSARARRKACSSMPPIATTCLVGVPSVEEPNLLRVNPGDPDSATWCTRSKVHPESRAVKCRSEKRRCPRRRSMPSASGSPNGAPNAPARRQRSQVAAVQSTAPLDHEHGATSAASESWSTFTQEVDASLVNESTVTLERIRPAALDPETSRRWPARTSDCRRHAPRRAQSCRPSDYSEHAARPRSLSRHGARHRRRRAGQSECGDARHRHLVRVHRGART